MLSARIGAIEFEGSPRDPDSAYMINPDGWSGWDEGPAVRREEVLRPTSHGSYDLAGFLTPRVTTISGWILASSPFELAQMRQRLTGLLSSGVSSRLTVETSAGTTWADVRLAGQTLVKVRGQSELEAEFQVQFWSADPRRYGEERSFGPGTSVTAWHYGNFLCHPVIEVTGNMPSGYTIRHGDRDLVVRQAITTGQTHRINTRTCRVYMGGNLQVGAVSQPKEIVIAPGGRSTIQLVPASGSGSLTVFPTDTFV